MKAVIVLDVPDWQIGQEVTVYFPDTMQKKAVCDPLQLPEPMIEDEHGWYCPKCKLKLVGKTASGYPCGIFDLPLSNDFVPVIERIKHERIQAEKPIPGQVTMF